MIESGGADWLKIAAYAGLATCAVIACAAWYVSDSIDEALDWQRIADEGDGRTASLLNGPNHGASLHPAARDFPPQSREKSHG